jgi:hypothetical protein
VNPSCHRAYFGATLFIFGQLSLFFDDFIVGVHLGLLLGQGVEYAVGNVFDPAYTMVCKTPTRLLQAVSAHDRRG